MFPPRIAAGIFAAGVLSLAAADQAAVDPWKKPTSEWTVDDAHQILTDSPWVKTVTPAFAESSGADQRTGPRTGGISIGIPGIGGIGRPGGGYPGGGYPGGSRYPGGGRPRGNYPDDSDRGPSESSAPPTLSVRWESALPIRAAELRSRDVDAPTVDEHHYAIAVIGMRRSMLRADSRGMENDLKKQAVLKRSGKKDFKPSSVQILQREEGPVIVYLFPKNTEIPPSDKQVEFDAQIGRMKFSVTFETGDMLYEGKLSL